MKILTTLFLFVTTFFAHAQDEQTGRAFIKALFTDKDYEKAHTFFDESISAQIPKDQLAPLVQQVEGQLGAFKNILEVNAIDGALYFYSEFEKVKMDIQLSFSGSHKIIGFFFKQHKEVREADKNELKIKSGDVLIEGTLLIPQKDNRKKLVIFLPGSGPQDRDETIADNKPLKDIADGLLANGIASYRFDKRTKTHPENFSPVSTIDDEYTVDALNIVAYFKHEPAYKDYEIILLGHSQGAYMLPRIYNNGNKDVSKLILMAGNARGLDELILEQYEYLSGQPDAPKELKDELAKVKQQVALLHSKPFSEATPAGSLPLGLPYFYWKSILDYKPLDEAKKIKVPVLVLQGERDYQVTLKDFNLWKKNVNAKNSKFISYPKLNHIFMEGRGEGQSTPDEYAIKGNVPEQVIKDISNFILQ